MDVRDILIKLLRREISIEEAERLVKLTAIGEVGEIAKLDVNRHFRSGIPEIVLAEGKSSKDLTEIIIKALERSGRVIVSRVNNEQLEFIQGKVPDNVVTKVNKKARIVVIKKKDFLFKSYGEKVGILAAGTECQSFL